MKVLIISLIITAIIAFVGLYISRKLNIMDKPWKYADIKRKYAVPTIQGFFLILAVIVNMAIILPGYWQFSAIKALFIWWVFLAIVALIDEYKNISPGIRMLIQIIVAIIWVIGWASITHLPIIGIDLPYWLWGIFAVIWFLLLINAFNWFDGINGMASGISTIWFLTIFLLINFIIIPAYPNIPIDEQTQLIVLQNLSIIFFSVSAIYTFIESKPYGLLRDAGIMFLGYSLAYLSLLWWAKIGIISVVLSLVIFDAIWVWINRLKNWQSPMKWDFTHFHHRFMANKWTRWEIRTFVWVWSAFMMILMILQWSDKVGKVIIFSSVAAIFFWVNIYLFWIKKIPGKIEGKKI